MPGAAGHWPKQDDKAANGDQVRNGEPSPISAAIKDSSPDVPQKDDASQDKQEPSATQAVQDLDMKDVTEKVARPLGTQADLQHDQQRSYNQCDVTCPRPPQNQVLSASSCSLLVPSQCLHGR